MSAVGDKRPNAFQSNRTGSRCAVTADNAGKINLEFPTFAHTSIFLWLLSYVFGGAAIFSGAVI